MKLSRPGNRLFNIVLLGLSLVLAGCASVKPVGESPNIISKFAQPGEINWPVEYVPEKASFYVHNEIEINASPETIWNILIQAEDWPSWYPGAFDVKVTDIPGGSLKANSRFTWNTMDFDFTSIVKEYDPPFRLSWETRRGLIQGYHAWLIIPTENGSRVITDESQYGFLALIQPIFVPDKLHNLHDVWLQELKEKAESLASVTSDINRFNPDEI